jgi:CRP-like cAMP-binding protein
VLLAVGSPVEAFAFNSLSFLVAAMMFSKLRVRCPGVGAEAAPNALALFVDGLRAVRHTRCVPVLTFLTFVGAFTYGAQTVQLVVYVQQRLHLSASGYGYLLAASGAGGVLGATISGRLAARMRIALPLVAGGLTFVGSELLYAAADITVVALTIGVATGVGMVVSDVVSETAITRATPRDLLGRVFASYDGITVGGMVLGALVAAPLVHTIGVRSSLVVLGTVVVVSMLLCLPTLLRLDRSVAGRVSALAPHTVALSKLDIFNGATHSALERLAAGVSEVRVREGTVIVAQGDVADAFYVCTQGSVVVTSAGERGHADKVLRHLSAPCYFGEIGLIEQIPRTATVTATTDCTLLRMEGSTFLDALTEAPAGTRTLAEGVMRGLARTHPSIDAGRTQELLQSIPRQAQPQDQEASTPVA